MTDTNPTQPVMDAHNLLLQTIANTNPHAYVQGCVATGPHGSVNVSLFGTLVVAESSNPIEHQGAFFKEYPFRAWLPPVEGQQQVNKSEVLFTAYLSADGKLSRDLHGQDVIGDNQSASIISTLAVHVMEGFYNAGLQTPQAD